MRVVALVVSVLVGFGSGTPAHASAAARAPISRVGAVIAAAPLSAVRQHAGPVPGVVATEIHWTRWSRQLVYGHSSILEGQVVTADGALPDADVDLYARRAGSTRWSLVASTATSSDTGVFRFDRHVPSATTTYRVVFEATVVYSRSEATKTVRVARRVRDSMTRIDSSAFRFGGSVAPTYSDRRIILQRRQCSGCTWSTVASKNTTARSRWSFRLTGPTTRGTWYYRAVVPADQLFVTSYSDHTWALTRG